MTTILNAGPELQASSYVTYKQNDSAVATLLNGGHVVVWTSYVQGGDNLWGTFCAVYDASGTRITTGDTLVNHYTNYDQIAPAITALSDGGFVITWESRNQESGSAAADYGIYCQRFDVNGVKLGSETLVNTTTADSQRYPATTSLNNGNYVIVWESNNQDGSADGIYFQLFNVTGNAVGVETRVNTTTALEQINPAITALNDGGYIVSWQSQVSGTNYDIYTQRYDVTGSTIGVETLINTTTTDSQAASEIIGMQDGGYLVAWQSNLQDGSSNGVYFQRYSSIGVKVGGETRANTTTINDQAHPAAALLTDGGFIITWQSKNQDSTASYGIYAQRYDANSNPIGPEFLVNNANNNDQVNQDVSALPNGGFVISYEGADNIYHKVYSATSDTSGTQYVYGTAGNDDLDGGAGADYMYGGLGNDTYHVDNVADVVAENTNHNEGIDTVVASITYTLADQYIENLTLSGAANNTGTGNASDNIIIGNAGNNTLYGANGNDTLDGSQGADTMYGGAGNDSYLVDNVADIVSESTVPGIDNGGVDGVTSSVNFTLAQFLENLTLSGTDNVNGTGNDSANVILGNSGDNMPATIRWTAVPVTTPYTAALGRTFSSSTPPAAPTSLPTLPPRKTTRSMSTPTPTVFRLVVA